MSEKIKTFELQGIRWQVSKLSALDGSNILRKFTNSGAANPQDFLSKMPDDEFKKIQDKVLSKVNEIKIIDSQEVPLPLILPSGVIGGIASEDAGLLLMLTVVALTFNLSGFFVGNALTEFETAVSQAVDAN